MRYINISSFQGDLRIEIFEHLENLFFYFFSFFYLNIHKHSESNTEFNIFSSFYFPRLFYKQRREKMWIDMNFLAQEFPMLFSFLPRNNIHFTNFCFQPDAWMKTWSLICFSTRFIFFLLRICFATNSSSAFFFLFGENTFSSFVYLPKSSLINFIGPVLGFDTFNGSRLYQQTMWF